MITAICGARLPGLLCARWQFGLQLLLDVDCEMTTGDSWGSTKRPFRWTGDEREVTFRVEGCELRPTPMSTDAEGSFQSTLPPDHPQDQPLNVYRYVIHYITNLDIDVLLHGELSAEDQRQQWKVLLKRLADFGYGNKMLLNMLFAAEPNIQEEPPHEQAEKA